MQIRAGRLISLLALTAMLTGCAPRTSPPDAPPTAAATPEPPATAPIDPADLIRRGCFACLERAFAAAREQDAAEIAFEAAALLVLRAKELGLPPDAWLDEARARAGADGFAQVVLEILEAVPADPLSGNRDAVLLQTPSRQRIRTWLPQWTEAVASGPGSLAFRQYLLVALACSVDETRGAARDEQVTTRAAEAQDVPLVQYASACAAASTPRGCAACVPPIPSSSRRIIRSPETPHRCGRTRTWTKRLACCSRRRRRFRSRPPSPRRPATCSRRWSRGRRRSRPTTRRWHSSQTIPTH